MQIFCLIWFAKSLSYLYRFPEMQGLIFPNFEMLILKISEMYKLISMLQLFSEPIDNVIFKIYNLATTKYSIEILSLILFETDKGVMICLQQTVT